MVDRHSAAVGMDEPRDHAVYRRAPELAGAGAVAKLPGALHVVRVERAGRERAARRADVKPAGARSVRISLNPFTLVGATTRSGLLTAPLRERFGITCPLEYYDTDELVKIVKRSARILKVDIAEQAAREIALRSRGTPRIANYLLRRVRDFAQVMGDGRIDLGIARYALDKLKIDTRGLDSIDNKILRTIITTFKGGPVGANTIATAISEDQGTFEEVYEPFLIKEGFIVRTQSGRIATELAYHHLGMDSLMDQEKMRRNLTGESDPSLF